MSDEIKLSTGRTIRPAFGIVGIDHELTVFEGYDGRLGSPTEIGDILYDAPELSAAEFIELADIMTGRWQALRALAERKT